MADALYHCFITALTVGYGDVPLSTQRARLWATFHIAFSVAWLAAFIARIDELRQARKAQLQRYDLLLRQLDTEMIASLDRNGLGVDRLEFVVGMLINLGAELGGQPLEWKDVEPFIARFDFMDKDGSGHLTQEDLVEFADKRTEKVSTQVAKALEAKKMVRATTVHLGSATMRPGSPPASFDTLRLGARPISPENKPVSPDCRPSSGLSAATPKVTLEERGRGEPLPSLGVSQLPGAPEQT
eukprot:TRINITY_DN18183_c0_g1_i2.p1 TRINITY_DN18183_c0_g1~~TRINITY_DN18183_c0_g1_i2.p1  ORF type:complete len:242 (-),score=35.70 TRINITY_DN18183_c0_g1_i2:83-808(-)